MKFCVFYMFLMATGGCSQFTSEHVKTALEVGKVLCIVANAESDEATVKTVCNILDMEQEAFKSVLTENRKASRQYARKAGACAPAPTSSSP